MASSSGNSTVSGSSVQNSGSEEKLQVLIDERKRKRMQSNRESARRSRMRKQKHLDDLMAEVTQLRKDNSQILNTINVTTRQYLNVEAHNSVLRAQMMELKQRLESLDDIINVINAASNNNNNNDDGNDDNDNNDNNNNNNNNEGYGFDPSLDGFFMSNNSMNMVYLNQPIMASPDLFQY